MAGGGASTWRSQYSRYQKYFLNIAALYKKRQDLRMFLDIILSLSAISIFALTALKPTFLTIAQLLKDIKTKEETISQMDQKISNLQQAQIILGEQRTTLSLLETGIPDQPTPETFVRQVEGTAKKNGVSVLGITVAETTLVGQDEVQVKKKEKESREPFPAGAKELRLSVSVAGDYPPLISFLTDLEKLRRPFLIDNLAINRTKTGDNTQTLVLTIAGRAPYIETK